MRSVVFCIAATLCVVGCKHQGAFSPQQQVVTKPITPKFELAGVWLPSPDGLFPQHSNQPVTIHKTDDGVFSINFVDAVELDVELRTTLLGEHGNYAIADVLASANGEPWLRYLGIIAHSSGTLSVWWIESKTLAKFMHAEGHSAVIERSTFGSKVFAEPQDLLDCITKHSRELVGNPVTFTRKTK